MDKTRRKVFNFRDDDGEKRKPDLSLLSFFQLSISLSLSLRIKKTPPRAERERNETEKRQRERERESAHVFSFLLFSSHDACVKTCVCLFCTKRAFFSFFFVLLVKQISG